jgi:hypothetical protein
MTDCTDRTERRLPHGNAGRDGEGMSTLGRA